MNIRTHAPLRAGLTGIATSITLGGCAAPTVPPPNFTEDPTVATSPEDRWRPSLDGRFDRRDWPTIRFEISMASVPCNPTYATPVVPDHGEVGRLEETTSFPTIRTAMSTETDRSRIGWSAVADPFVAAFDLVASPFRMIGAPPDSTVLEPDGDWQLLPGDEAPARVETPPDADPNATIDADPTSTEPDGSPDEAPDATATTTGDSGGWTISPAFDRPPDAAASRTAE